MEYTYDAWGNIVSTTGSMASTLGQANPFRYRGYYYDAETGFYYLNSRYYDPSACRFINADDVSYLNADGTPLSCNLYSYCGNNPVTKADHNGTWGHIVAGAIIGVVSSAISLAVDHWVFGKDVDFWDVVISIGFGAVEGALTAAIPSAGVVISSVFGVAESFVSSCKDSVKGVDVTISDIVIDATISGVFGAISGAWGNGKSDALLDNFCSGVKMLKEAYRPALKRAAKSLLWKSGKKPKASG